MGRKRKRQRQPAAGPKEREIVREDPELDALEKGGIARSAAVVLLPALAAVLVFANTLSNGLVYDDRWTLDRIPDLSTAVLWEEITHSRGLTYLLHAWDRWLWGEWVPGFHLTNIFLHAVASALATAAALVLTSRRRVALVCGLLFAVHPVHAEVVASFSYRKDSLAMVFVLLAWILWLGRGWAVLRYAAAALCFLFGLLSKEVAAVGLAPMLFFGDLLPGHGHPDGFRARLKRAAWRSAPFLVVGAAAGIWILSYVSFDRVLASIEHESNGVLTSYTSILATSLASIPEVVRLLVFPFALSADYVIQPAQGFGDARAVIGILGLVGWGAGIFFFAKRNAVVALSAAWVVLTYLPVSNVVPLTHFFVAERYLYVPSFGFCLLVAIGLSSAGKAATAATPARWKLALTVFLVLFGSVRSMLRNRDWRDDRALWTSSLKAGVDTNRVRGNLAISLVADGRTNEAISHFRSALFLHPCTKWRLPLAHALHRIGHYDAAIEECGTILEQQPGNAEARNLRKQIRRELREKNKQRKSGAPP